MAEGEPQFEEELPQSSINKIVGGTEAEQKKVLGQLGYEMQTDSFKDFEYNGKFYWADEFEREKTEGEIGMISDVLGKIEEFMKEMGSSKSLKIRPEQIRVLDREKAKKERFPLAHFYNQEEQCIFVYDLGDSLANMQGVTHEAIHMHSFQSMEITRGKWAITRRLGLGVKVKGEDFFYFDEINEALTEELAIRFDRKYFKLVPGLEKEIKERQDFCDSYLKGDPNEKALSEEIAYIVTDPNTLEKVAVPHSYPNERSRLNDLINDIFEKNKEESGGVFKSEDEVFVLFVEATTSGKMLKLSRIIEKTYGKGSFRKLGSKTQTKG
jgi:hypothetical protein